MMDEAEREANHRRNLAAAMADPSPMQWWWLSFANPMGFLGAAMVEAPNMIMAIYEAHLRKINPGGEVQGTPLPDWAVPHLDHQNVLLDRAGCEAADAHFLTLRPAKET